MRNNALSLSSRRPPARCHWPRAARIEPCACTRALDSYRPALTQQRPAARQSCLRSFSRSRATAEYKGAGRHWAAPLELSEPYESEKRHFLASTFRRSADFRDQRQYFDIFSSLQPGTELHSLLINVNTFIWRINFLPVHSFYKLHVESTANISQW